MLLPSISNTTIKCLPITFNFVNTDKRKKAKACEKILPVTQRDSKNLLTTKLLTNLNFVFFIRKRSWSNFQFHNIDLLFYLSFQRKNHKTIGFNVFQLEYILKMFLQVFQLNLWCALTSKITCYTDWVQPGVWARQRVGCGVQMVRCERY